MIEGLVDKLTGTDALIRAMRGHDRQKFARVFGHFTVLFLQVPTGCEGGLDPNVTQEEFLSHLRSQTQDISQREQFTPFCRIRAGRRALLLFTAQSLAQQFAQAYVRTIKRIMPFGVLGVQGKIATRLFSGVDSVVFNASTKYEYELSAVDVQLLKTLFPPTSAETR